MMRHRFEVILLLVLTAAPAAAFQGPTGIGAVVDLSRTPTGAIFEAKVLGNTKLKWVERTQVDKVIAELELQAVFSPEGGSKRAGLGKLLMGTIRYALSMDLDTEAITAIVNVDPASYIPFKSPRNPKAFSGTRILLPVGNQLIYVDHNIPYTGSLSALEAGDDRPKSIIEKCFPDRPDHYVIKDLAPSRQGLLLLTSSGLFVSPGIRDESMPPILPP